MQMVELHFAVINYELPENVNFSSVNNSACFFSSSFLTNPFSFTNGLPFQPHSSRVAPHEIAEISLLI